jgi:hypothetical protein
MRDGHPIIPPKGVPSPDGFAAGVSPTVPLMNIQESMFSIVVVGEMNPAIHHPLWYSLTGLIDEEEKEVAIKRPIVIISAPVQMSQFETSKFTVICNQGAWEIRTSIAEQRNRIREITRKVFDEVLKYTPVRMFGFNFNREYNVGREGVGEVLGRLACRTGLDFCATNPVSAEIKVVEVRGGARVSVLVKPGSEDTAVSVSTNVEYKREVAEFGFFDMQGFLGEEYEMRFQESETVGQRIATAISKSE